MDPGDITVTKTFLPPIEEYNCYLDGIWQRGWLTNHGPLVNELEQRLATHLGVEHVLFMANGTLALQIAIKTLGLVGEVITTPFSYVATTSAIVWEHCTPVLVDIDPNTLTIDPALLESAITERTSGIIATHVYGNACDVDQIQQIADRHGLKVLYDAAHAFGSTYNGESLLSYGDLSTASFHATKVFHTVEGGAICTTDEHIASQASLYRNFGHTGANEFACVGINGKNSELHAAMGLANLPYLERILARRRQLSERYDRNLVALPIRRPIITRGCGYNHAYYPIILDSESTLLRLVQGLQAQKIFPRRYFYPSLSWLPYVAFQHDTPVSDDLASRVLCLPLYDSLALEQVDEICAIVEAECLS